MAKLTRCNIAYDFNISPYKLTVEYDTDEITFVFSSELYRNKFIAGLGDNRNKINRSLSNRFGFQIVNDVLCDLKLYITIEKRGFLLYKGEQKIECLNNLTLNGNHLTM